MEAFVRFMATSGGRWLRVVAGAALTAIGAALGGGWWALAVVGALFVLVGALDVCLIAPLVGLPVRGRDVR
jgi:hypothetical protein